MRLLVQLSIAIWWVSFTTAGIAESNKPGSTKVTFEDHVKPIFRQHCFSCHNQGEQKGGLALDTFTSVVEGGGSGEIVFDDGDADGSRLWQLMNHDDSPEMPPNQDKVPQEQLAVVRRWIEGGILENLGSKAKPKKQNALAFVASTGGRPAGSGAMPQFNALRSQVVTERPAAVTAIAASPWAPLVAIAGQKQVVLYHTDTAELLGILPFEEGVAQGLRFSRSGDFLIASGGEHSVSGIVVVYDIKTGKRVAIVGDELDSVFDGDANRSMTQIALGGPKKMLRIFDAADGTPLFELKKHTDWIYSIAYSPDGVLVASGDRSGGLCVWESMTGRLYLDLTDHKGAIHSLAWRDDSNVLASASADGTLKLWDMNQGKAVKTINVGKPVHDVSFDHQGRLVSGGRDKRAKLWDASGKHVRDFPSLTEDVLEVEISHDGKHVIYGDWAGDILLVNTENPKRKAKLAANPPALRDRVESVKKRIASLEREMKPITKRLSQKKHAWEAAKRPIFELKAKIAEKQTAADQANQRIKESTAKVASIDARLPAMVASSRDMQDALISIRVTSKDAPPDDPNIQLTLASAEQAYANHLLALSEIRKQRIKHSKFSQQTKNGIAEIQQQISKLRSGLPELGKSLEVALKAWESSKVNHQNSLRKLNKIRNQYQKMISGS